MPIGGIIAYTGSLRMIPSNYHLCDGTNGTPDLRDRFIVGAGNSYNLNSVGGTSTNILALNQLPNLADFLNSTIAVQGNNQVNGSENLISSLPVRAWSWEYFKKMKVTLMVILEMLLLQFQEQLAVLLVNR